MTDEHGRPPLGGSRDRPFRSHWSLASVLLLVAFVALSLVLPELARAGLVGIPLVLAGAWLTLAVFLVARLVSAWRDGRDAVAVRRARAARLLEEAGDAQPIGSIRSGLVRVRGLVRIVRPVTPPDAGPRWAAFHDASGSGRCGRFAVVDASGTAFVDDDCFEIWTSGLRRHGGALEEGRTVEVIGPAALTRLGAADAVAGADPYRGHALAVSFDGTPTVPVIIVALPARG